MFLLFYLVCGRQWSWFVDWYSNFLEYLYHSFFQILCCFVLRNALNLHALLSWILFKFILAMFYINYSFNFLVFDFRRLDVFSATANLPLMILSSFRRSWNFFDKSPSLLLITLFFCSSSVCFLNISGCSALHGVNPN